MSQDDSDTRLRALASRLSAEIDVNGVYESVTTRTRSKSGQRVPWAVVTVIGLALAIGAYGLASLLPKSRVPPARVQHTGGMSQAPATSASSRGGPSSVDLEGELTFLGINDQGQASIYRTSVDEGTTVELGAVMNASSLSVSPDGSQVLVSEGIGEGTGQLVLLNANGQTSVFFEGDVPQDPAWSPDASAVAFRTGSGDIYLLRDGTSQPEQLTDSGSNCSDLHPAWTPDGRGVTFDRDCTDATSGLFTAGLSGEPLTELLALPREEPVQALAWSPDGSELAFVRPSGKDQGTFLLSADGSLTQITSEADGAIAWSSDGKAVALVRGDALWVISLSDGSEVAVSTPEGVRVRSLAALWEPKGNG